MYTNSIWCVSYHLLIRCNHKVQLGVSEAISFSCLWSSNKVPDKSKLRAGYVPACLKTIFTIVFPPVHTVYEEIFLFNLKCFNYPHCFLAELKWRDCNAREEFYDSQTLR